MPGNKKCNISKAQRIFFFAFFAFLLFFLLDSFFMLKYSNLGKTCREVIKSRLFRGRVPYQGGGCSVCRPTLLPLKEVQVLAKYVLTREEKMIFPFFIPIKSRFFLRPPQISKDEAFVCCIVDTIPTILTTNFASYFTVTLFLKIRLTFIFLANNSSTVS